MCPQNDFLFWVDLYFHCFLFIYLLHSWAQVLRKKYSFSWKPKKWRVSIFHLTFPIPQPCPWISPECARKRPPPTLAAWCPDAFVNPLELLSAPAVSEIHAFSQLPRTFFPTLHLIKNANNLTVPHFGIIFSGMPRWIWLPLLRGPSCQYQCLLQRSVFLVHCP